MHRRLRNVLQRNFHFLEPTFVAGLLDDPVLLLRNRPFGDNLLFDCGQLHHLAKRILKRIDTIFISHAHMDHFAGMTTLTRNILVAPKTVDLYGPAGLSERLEHLLAGFDWNLSEDFWCSFRVHEIDQNSVRHFLLPGPDRFRRRFEDETERHDSIILRNRQLQVGTALCDHKIPSAIYRIDELPSFGLDPEKMASMRLAHGQWIQTFKDRFKQGELENGPLTVLVEADGAPQERLIDDVPAFYQQLKLEQQPLSIGYVTDVGFTKENREKIGSLLHGIDLLICECSYIAADVDKARESHHLCSTDLNQLMTELLPSCVMPIHLSKLYTDNCQQVLQELQPPDGCHLLQLPERIVPRPLLPNEIPLPEIKPDRGND